ncbi:MAG: hypothetical protein P4L90_03050 [Rhodopila sp.]|nr:hypothetical protein [Rhodopila sp.]
MKIMVLAAFAALSLTASCTPVAGADRFGRPQTTYPQGPYDNTGHGGSQGGGGGGD